MQWSPPSQGPRAAQGWAVSRDFVGGTLLPPAIVHVAKMLRYCKTRSLGFCSLQSLNSESPPVSSRLFPFSHL